MLKAIYSEIKHIIRASLTSYRTSLAGAICIIGSVFMALVREDYALAFTLFVAGAGLIAGQDVIKKQP